MNFDQVISDKSTFIWFYKQSFQSFTLLAIQYVANKDIAEDIVQDVFIKYWENPPELENPKALKSYLGRMVINSAINHLKREQNVRRIHVNINQDLTEKDVYDKLHEQELKVLIYKEIEQLPGQCKKVFKMNRFDHLKYREIAKQLNISERTVENHIANALKVLRKRLFVVNKAFGDDLMKYKPLLVLLGVN
jgi:RNA polymerase sigma-70 factor (family 1)